MCTFSVKRIPCIARHVISCTADGLFWFQSSRACFTWWPLFPRFIGTDVQNVVRNMWKRLSERWSVIMPDTVVIHLFPHDLEYLLNKLLIIYFGFCLGKLAVNYQAFFPARIDDSTVFAVNCSLQSLYIFAFSYAWNGVYPRTPRQFGQ